MPDLPAHPPPGPSPPLRSYEEFLEDIKARIRTAQARAARAINTELVEVYWQVGREILRRQAQEGPERGRRTPGVIQRLSADLRAAFPGARGYSVPSLYRMRALAAAWPERLSDRMRDLPWGHIVTITTKATEDTRDWYAERAAASSQEQLEDAIATRLHQREAAAITNFARTLEAGDAVAVQRITRDPLILDFVELAESARERDLEAALPSDIERFMLALGEGFYFAGRQRSLQVGGDEFVLDLLFYTTRPAACRHRPEGPPLRAEFAGKMNLYVNAVNELIGHDTNRTTVGFILCTDRDKTVAQLTLQGIATPIAITRYTIGKQGVEMTGEEAEITEGVDEEMESMRAASSSESPSSQRAERANSPTAPAQETRVDRRPRASVRLNHSRAGQERGTLRQAGGNPQRWHEAVERDDQHPALDPLQTSGPHDAQDRERPAPAPAPPAEAKP